MDYAQLNKAIEAITLNCNTLGSNIVMGTGRVKDSIGNLNTTLATLNKTITDYSGSSDRQAKAMKWLTAALVGIGVLQVIFNW